MNPLQHCFPKHFIVKDAAFLSSDKLMWELHLVLVGNGGIEDFHSVIYAAIFHAFS